jgi:predicted HTH transcriptional regulator
MVSNIRLEAITYDDINHLVSSGYREDQNLDYKEQLPDLDGKKPDDARKKLLIDVAAFANAGGGDILFGVEEGRSNGQPNGIPVALPGIASPNVRLPA